MIVFTPRAYRMLRSTPAATAEPITPATLGPIACISRKLPGFSAWPTFWENTGRHGHRRHACRANEGVDLPAGELIHELAEEHTAGRADAEGDEAQEDNADSAHIQEHGTCSRSAHRHAQENGDDVHQLILCGIGNPVNYAALPHEIAQHEHTHQRRRIRQQQGKPGW